MIFTLLKRVFREHTGAHLWVPVAVTALLSAAIDLPVFLVHGGKIDWRLLSDWSAFWAPWLRDHWRELLGIYLAFIWVVWKSVRSASDVRWTMIGDLADALDGASRYFAIGTIPLREWFEPNTLVYLATIIQQQYHAQSIPSGLGLGAGSSTPALSKPSGGVSFRHERVLLFYDDASLQALQASYLDQHYARSFSAIHDRFDIPLAYLKPQEIHQILSELKPEYRWILAPCRWFARPQWLWRRGFLRRFSRNMRVCRPFAIVYRGDEEVILRFSKNGDSLMVDRTTDLPEVQACSAFVSLIEKAIYKTPGHHELFEHCRFSKYLSP